MLAADVTHRWIRRPLWQSGSLSNFDAEHMIA